MGPSRKSSSKKRCSNMHDQFLLRLALLRLSLRLRYSLRLSLGGRESRNPGSNRSLTRHEDLTGNRNRDAPDGSQQPPISEAQFSELPGIPKPQSDANPVDPQKVSWTVSWT